MHPLEPMPCAVRNLAQSVLSVGTLVVVLSAGLAHAQSELLPAPPATDTAAEELPQAENVLEIRILGNDTISTDQISGQISTRVGRPFDRSIVQRDVRQLANLGWFVDVKPL